MEEVALAKPEHAVSRWAGLKKFWLPGAVACVGFVTNATMEAGARAVSLSSSDWLRGVAVGAAMCAAWIYLPRRK